VTGFNQNGKLLTIQYTWYVGDPAADEFRYASDDSGELLVELSGDTFRYLSNKVIETPDTETAANPEGYNIREKYGLIVLNDRYEKLLMALVWNGITRDSWQSPEEIDPDCFVLFFYLMRSDPYNEIEFNESRYEQGEMGWLIPAEEVEEAVRRHFDVSIEHIRESGYYMPDKNVYWFGGTGSVANARITGVRQDGEIHLIDYDLYQDIELVGSGVLMVRFDERESDNEYQYLSNEFVPIPLTDEEQRIKDSLIVVGSGMTLEEKICTGLALTGCATQSWQNAEEMFPSELLSIYSFLASIGDISIPEDVERHPYYKEPYLPAAEVERVVQSYYDVSTEYLRSYNLYDVERGVYQMPSIHSGAECRLVESKQDGNVLTITFEIYQSLHLDCMVTITTEIQADGGYKYLSCESEWVG